MKSFVVVLAFLTACACANPLSKYFPPMKRFGRGDVDFVAADLPCSFAIHGDNEYRIIVSGQAVSENMWYDLVVDNDVTRYTTYSYNNESYQHKEDVIRADKRFKRDGETFYPTYSASSKDGSCATRELPKDVAKKEIAEYLSVITAEYEFINVTGDTYNGIPCKKYFTTKEDDGTVLSFTLYAAPLFGDTREYIIGLIREMTSENETLASISTLNLTYNFDISLTAFSVNQTAFPNCADDAYTAATEQCGLYSSGASSGSESSGESDSNFDFSSSSSKVKSKSDGDSSADLAFKTQATVSVVLAAIATAIAVLF